MGVNGYWLKKLVRDRAAARMTDEGARVVSRRLGEDEFRACLHEKLREEFDELAAAKTPAEKAEEIADILEILDSYAAALGLSPEDMRRIQAQKRDARGGFEGREFVEYIEAPEGSVFDLYCRKSPDKYARKPG